MQTFSMILRGMTLVGLTSVTTATMPSAIAAQDTPWPTNGWAVSTPSEQGLSAEPLAALHGAIEAGTYGYIDRLLIVRNGHLVMNERYDNDYREISRGFKGDLGCGADACDGPADVHQYNYYHPDWHPFHQGRNVHSLQSVTKSIAATLIGVALGQGDIESLAAPVLSFFADYDLTDPDDRLRRATLEDLLTMRLGMEWHEVDRPIGPDNTTLQLEWSDDWIQFTLDQPMEAEPGEKWVYNSGASHLMSGIIKQATGRYIDEYAEQHLFRPLGITEYYWKKTPKGYPDTEGGLYLEAEDLARLGYLYLNDGVWDGRRILPEGWVAVATARQVDDIAPSNASNDRGYGYQWWRLDRGGVEVWAGLGFGGQYLIVIPERDLMGVVNSWNVFGGNRTPILDPFIDALLESAIVTGE